MPETEVAKTRERMEISVSDPAAPRPILAFDHLVIDKRLKARVESMSYERPTPIQCQALPCALSGRDVIGIAKTGSGKTLAYIIPMLIHIMDQVFLSNSRSCREC